MNRNSNVKKTKIAVLASGSGTNLQAIINAQKNSFFPGEVALVLSDRKDAFALQRASREMIPAVFQDPFLFPDKKSYDAALLNLFRQKQIDLIVLAGYMRLLSSQIVQAFYHSIINIHPSLLPSFPGRQGIKDALHYGVKITGVTVHFVDQGMDTGPIILQEAVRVKDDDDLESLRVRIQKVEHRLYPEAVKLFCQGRLSLRERRCYINNEKKSLDQCF